MSELYDLFPKKDEPALEPESSFFLSSEQENYHWYDEHGPVEINYAEQDLEYPVELTCEITPGQTIGLTLSKADLKKLVAYYDYISLEDNTHAN